MILIRIYISQGQDGEDIIKDQIDMGEDISIITIYIDLLDLLMVVIMDIIILFVEINKIH